MYRGFSKTSVLGKVSLDLNRKTVLLCGFSRAIIKRRKNEKSCLFHFCFKYLFIGGFLFDTTVSGSGINTGTGPGGPRCPHISSSNADRATGKFALECRIRRGQLRYLRGISVGRQQHYCLDTDEFRPVPSETGWSKYHVCRFCQRRNNHVQIPGE